MPTEIFTNAEKPLNLTKLKADLLNCVNDLLFPKEKDALMEGLLQKLRQKYINAIDSGDKLILSELEKDLVIRLDYDRKYRETKLDREKWDQLDQKREDLAQWIKLL